ncbi:MAG: DNA mismatch repair endonuclease MutL [Deltaproteobacteria bacterium]|nr:DNA mismatch repair endonuclease MutL [Deltaproteobacteria bacterium]
MTQEDQRRVRLLPDSLINKIAAGEVVERPASVVKELVENAVDARSTRIVVSIRGGGRGLIRVRDDGTGMGREDALAALQRHATSKVRTDEDLFSIDTFGFRGEALPSIAEVSRFELTTGEPGATAGTRVLVDGGVIETIEEAANPGGTEISVKRLFANTPARLKFLKTERTEMNHVQEWVTRVALAHPEIAMRLEADDRTVFDLPPEDGLMARVRGLLGKAVAEKLRPFSADQGHGGLSVEGLVSLPTLTRSSAAGLYLFVNGRFVKDRAMTGAVLQAWRDLLPRGRYPVAVLFLDLPPDRVDVNVHPQKLEVRFRDGQQVWRFLSGALAQHLRGLGGVLAEPEEQTSFLPPAARGGLRPRVSMPDLGTAAHPVRPWSQDRAAAVLDRATLPGQRPVRPIAPSAPPAGTDSLGLRVVGMLDRGHLVCSDAGALVLIDVLAARRLLLFGRLLRAPSAPLEARRLLVPGLLDLEPADVRALEKDTDEVLPFGVEVSAFGPDVVALHALAPEFDGSRGAELLIQLRQALRDGPPKGPARTRELARVLSAFVHPGPEHPAPKDLQAFVGRFLAVAQPHPPDLPNPRIRVESADIARWFRRGRP